MDNTFLQLLPLAFVMVAGPQILSAIFLATSEDWQKNSFAYVAGAALSITIITSAAFFLINGASDDGGPAEGIYVAVLVLLVAAMIHCFVKRKQSEPPKWMGKLESATPKFSFRLGFLLLGVFPSDLLTSIAIGSFLGNHGDAWWHLLPFIGLTVFFLAIPALLIIVLRQRAQEFLPKMREWMNDNSWVVNELVLLLFVVICASSL